MSPKRILFLTRYSELGASSRCRSYQFIPALAERGFIADIQPLLPDSYLRRQYEGGGKFGKMRAGLEAVARRWWLSRSFSHYDAVVVEKELYPYLPLLLESGSLSKAARLILDFDDAVWVSYRNNPLLRNKIGAVMAGADAVIVGSRYLEDYARKFNGNVRFIPTVVDVRRYKPKHHSSGPVGPVRVGWIGTPVTIQFLPEIRSVVQSVAEKRPLLFISIGAGDGTVFPGVLTRSIPWSYETEAESLLELDVGIMPLNDDEFAKGKCGYKLIQYMAAGLPSVASDVGENRNILVHGETGFVARTPEEWERFLLELCSSDALRRRMGASGRARVESHYRLETALDELADVLAETCERPARSRAAVV